MAKGKNLNPADAHRKAQRAKELKKESNKENRAKARETAAVKKDIGGLEKEIHELEDIGEEKLSSLQKERLKELRTEVARIRKIKQNYVKIHPEQTHLVRDLEERSRRPDGVAGSSGGNASAVRSVFGKNGLPLHPERSIYYDPVLNPYGVPPPGMPYAERPLLPHEIEEDNARQGISQVGSDGDLSMESGGSDSEDDDDASDDDGIALPAGPPPSGSAAKKGDASSQSSSDDSDDDIPMPPGPPPPRSVPPLPEGPLPTMAPFSQAAPYGTTFPPFAPNASLYTQASAHVLPPSGFPTTTYPGYSPYMQTIPPYPQQASISTSGPKSPRDRQFAEAVRIVQDPLSNVPHITYQVHQAQKHQLPPPPPAAVSGPQAPSHHGLPPKPGSIALGAASATISAEPELRDLKKEATAFVPTSMRRAAKKSTNASGASGLHINAAPNEAGDDHAQPSAEPRKDLMSVLGSQLGVTDKSSAASNNKAGQGKDDYEKFLDEVGSFL